MKHLFTLLASLLCFSFAYGQPMSWRKHVRIAEDLYKDREYADAADHFERAWRLKTDRLEYMYRSAECYYTVRHFRKAGESFRIVRDRTDEFPLASLKYAQCLKNRGRYPDAMVEFKNFLKKYEGKDKDTIGRLVENEIAGCELGLRLAESAQSTDIEIEHLGANVNTPESEFAPIPFSDDILYFSSTMAGKAKIYRSQQRGGEWTQAVEPGNFPEIKDEHFCNGAFSPDKKRFYFTQCQSTPTLGGMTARCEIYVTRRVNNDWTAPERLRDYVNPKDATTTHPYVVHEVNTEIVYFASDRKGGRGGMDIWYMERDLRNDDIDFSFPANVGPEINSSADEVTPFYDPVAGSLYFSSNGRINIGGFDIFQAKGNRSYWSDPEILPAPINSSADDYFFQLKPMSRDGFFVSNRLFGIEKITTTQEDIFAFYKPMSHAMVHGIAQDKLSKKPVEDVSVRLYEVLEGDNKRLLDVREAKDGAFRFDLIPYRNFRLEASKDGYVMATADFNTTALESPIRREQNLLLQKLAPNQMVRDNQIVAVPRKATQISNSSPVKRPPLPSTINPEKQEQAAVERPKSNVVNTAPATYTSYAKTPGEPYPFESSAPRHQGVYYKVQLIAVAHYDPEHQRFDPVRKLGRLDSEYIPKMKLTRVLLADYFSLAEAERILSQVNRYRVFQGAYIVRYEEGERLGRWQ